MIQVIPAIDVMNGKCVRLAMGDFSRKTIYEENPIELAKRLEQNGITRLHLVDLDGALAREPVNLRTLEDIVSTTSLSVDFGGGVQSATSVAMVFASGAAQVSLGSMAVNNRALFLDLLKEYGADRIILGADAKNRQIALSGWTHVSTLDVQHFIREFYMAGVREVICTDISRDGMLGGPSVDLYAQIMEDVPGVRLIASGGVRNADDIARLNDIGMYGVIFGKALYEGYLTTESLSPFLVRV